MCLCDARTCDAKFPEKRRNGSGPNSRRIATIANVSFSKYMVSPKCVIHECIKNNNDLFPHKLIQKIILKN